MLATVDVLVVTALKEELDALLKVTAGVVEPWHEVSEGDVHHLATLEGQHGPIRVAAARTTQMAGVATAIVATRLAERLSPRCLAMCGVCAGRPEDTDLGDVVIADRVFHHDYGKLKSDGFQGDQWGYPLGNAWLRTAQNMAGPAEGLDGYVVADEGAGRWWFLEQLLAGRDPMRSVAFRRYVPDTRRPAMLKTLLRDSYVSLTGQTFSLTEAGRAAAHEREVLYGTLATERPYHIHVGPIGSGNYVAAHGVIWKHLAENQAMRKTLAVEMEAAAVGQVAHERSLPFVVVKGVMDHADSGKTDRFKDFAARASAAVLCAFLRRVIRPLTDSSQEHGPDGDPSVTPTSMGPTESVRSQANPDPKNPTPASQDPIRARSQRNRWIYAAALALIAAHPVLPQDLRHGIQIHFPGLEEAPELWRNHVYELQRAADAACTSETPDLSECWCLERALNEYARHHEQAAQADNEELAAIIDARQAPRDCVGGGRVPLPDPTSEIYRGVDRVLTNLEVFRASDFEDPQFKHDRAKELLEEAEKVGWRHLTTEVRLEYAKAIENAVDSQILRREDLERGRRSLQECLRRQRRH